MTSDNQSPKQEPPPSGLASFWAELKRRKVMRVAITYAVVAWLIIQIANATFAEFGIPLWAYRFVVIMLLCFFPVAIILAWAFELTPDGIKTTKLERQENVDTMESKDRSKKRNWLAFLFGAALPTLIFGIAAGIFYAKFRKAEEQAQVAQQSLYEKSIAVLPLDNLSPDPENAFFADGVQEDIIGNLSKINDLLVIGRTSTLGYRETTKKLKEIGRELSVRYLLEGSIRRAANQVKISVKLIDSQNEAQLWYENYSRNLSDIFAIQAEIAKEIANQLQAVISPEEIERIDRRPTENQEAYDLYIQAHQSVEQGWDLPSFGKIALLEKAVTLDPGFAEAWALMAYGRIVSWNLRTFRTDSELLGEADKAIDEAIKLQPKLPDVLFAQSTFYTHRYDDLDTAINLLLETLTIEPNFNLSRWELGILYFETGRLIESQIHLEESVRIDPFSSRSNTLLAFVYELRGLWDKAQTLIENNYTHIFSKQYAQWRLAQSEFLRTGDVQPLVTVWRSNFHVDEHITKIWLLLHSRDYHQALRLIKNSYPHDSARAIDTSWFSIDIRPLNLLSALLYFELGDREKSIEEVEMAKPYLENLREPRPELNIDRWSKLAICYALENNRDKMETAIIKARDLISSSKVKFFIQSRGEFEIAIAYLVIGDHDKAITILEEAVRLERRHFLKRELELWFIFDRLKGNSRFDALLAD